MKFCSSKGVTVIAIIAFMVIMTIISFLDETHIISGVMIAMISYFIWMWFDTYYIIDNNKLHYKCGLIKGSIDIRKILDVSKNKKFFAGLKPALSGKGIVIKYNKWDEIYVSPENMGEFIAALQEVNPDIKIIV